MPRKAHIIDRRYQCACGAASIRSEKYDAYYCPICNEWLESKCGDLAGDPCIYCKDRPEKPLES